MERKKRIFFGFTAFFGIAAVAILSAALATDFWVVAYPKRNVDKDTESGARNVTGGDLDSKFKGYVKIGLFHGVKTLDHGLGPREVEIWAECDAKENLCGFIEGRHSTELERIIKKYRRGAVADELSDHNLFNFALWVCTIIFTALGIVWGLVAVGFAILNASTKPIETITGPMGLYVWNLLAAFFCILAVVVYVVLYFTDLKENVLSPEDRETFRWTSKDMAYLHYSFYFVVVAVVLYILNMILVACSGVECRAVRYKGTINDKALDGVMMY